MGVVVFIGGDINNLVRTIEYLVVNENRKKDVKLYSLEDWPTCIILAAPEQLAEIATRKASVASGTGAEA